MQPRLCPAGLRRCRRSGRPATPICARARRRCRRVTYRDIFRDPRLQALIEQALANNRDLRSPPPISPRRARSSASSAPNQFPAVGRRRRDRGDTGDAAAAARRSARYQAGFSLPSFELDLFGRLPLADRRRAQPLFRDRGGGAGDAAHAGRPTSPTPGSTYAADSEPARDRRRTPRPAPRSSVELTRARLEGGIAPRTDLRQAEQVLDTARRRISPSRRTALAQDVNALQLLVGAPIDPALLPASIDEAAPTVAELPAGLDSQILLRRPDVVQAEYQLRAANAEIGAARAALFPRISLTGLLGLASNALARLFTGGAFAWQAGGDADLPDLPRRRGPRQCRGSPRRSATPRSRATSGRSRPPSARSPTRSRGAARSASRSARGRREQRDAAADTYSLADARYRGGIDSFLGSLDAQRSYYAAQRTLVLSRARRGDQPRRPLSLARRRFAAVGSSETATPSYADHPPPSARNRSICASAILRVRRRPAAPRPRRRCARHRARRAKSIAPSRCWARVMLAARSASSRAALQRGAAVERVGVGGQRGLGLLQRAQHRAVERGERGLRVGLGAGDAGAGRLLVGEGPADQRAEQPARAGRRRTDRRCSAPVEPIEPPSVMRG